MIFNKLVKTIERGRKGENIFIPLSLKSIGRNLRIGPNTYILFAGASGTGKTAICMNTFVLDIFDWWVKNKDTARYEPKWIIRSMERSSEHLVAKWLCYRIYKDYNILIDVPTLLSWPNAKYPLDDKMSKIINSYEDYFKNLLDHIHIVDGSAKYSDIYNENMSIAESLGSFTGSEYKPNNPKQIVIHITDHIGKITGSGSEKQILDRHVDNMCDVFRDKCGWLVIDVMQLNRGGEESFRRKSFGADILASDLQGSSKPYHNSDICLGMMNPYALGDFMHRGYDIAKMYNGVYNRFRSIKCVKNSWGPDNWIKGLAFVGECGAVFELPRSKEMTSELYDAVRECQLNTYQH